LIRLQIIKSRVLTNKIFGYLVSKYWPNLDIDATELPANVIYVFLGAMAAALDHDVLSWFQDAFGPLIDAAVAAYSAHLELVSFAIVVSKLTLICRNESSTKKRRLLEGEAPTAKRTRLSQSERKVVHYTKGLSSNDRMRCMY
jgi:hypothetical protein